ncbi:MAG: VTT domain-containing protein [Candidatus Paceibacterota bacterium]|jgi:membrane-associated protein
MITELINTLTDPMVLIGALGTIGVISIIFLETGVPFGFFFPGDSLLFTAGLLASQGYASLTWLLIGTVVAAIVGDNVGYYFGRRVGPSIFTKDDSLFFNKKHVAKAQLFFEKYGRKTIILARFIPIIRTFAPILAGVGSMNYRTFVTFNIIGGFLWTWSMLLLGYGFGSIIPDPEIYILPIIGLIIVVSFIPALLAIFRKKQ